MITSHRMKLDEAAEGYRIFHDKQQECRKVVLTARSAAMAYEVGKPVARVRSWTRRPPKVFDVTPSAASPTRSRVVHLIGS